MMNEPNPYQSHPEPGAPPYSAAPPTPTRPPQNGLGTAGFVLGLLGLIFSFIPVIGVIAWPLAILGLIFGIIGFSRARQGTATNKGMAMAGIVLAAVAIVISAVWTAVFGMAFNESLDSSGSAPAGTNQEAQAPAEQPDAAGVSIGNAVQDGKFEFVVTEISRADAVGDAPLQQTAQGEYVIVHLTVTNIGNEAQFLSDTDQYLYDAEGKKYSADSVAGLYLGGEANDSVWLQEINPGNTVEGKIVFDMPAGGQPVRAELHDSAFSEGVVVNLP